MADWVNNLSTLARGFGITKIDIADTLRTNADEREKVRAQDEADNVLSQYSNIPRGAVVQDGPNKGLPVRQVWKDSVGAGRIATSPSARAKIVEGVRTEDDRDAVEFATNDAYSQISAFTEGAKRGPNEDETNSILMSVASKHNLPSDKAKSLTTNLSDFAKPGQNAADRKAVSNFASGLKDVAEEKNPEKSASMLATLLGSLGSDTKAKPEISKSLAGSTTNILSGFQKSPTTDNNIITQESGLGSQKFLGKETTGVKAASQEARFKNANQAITDAVYQSSITAGLDMNIIGNMLSETDSKVGAGALRGVLATIMVNPDSTAAQKASAATAIKINDAAAGLVDKYLATYQNYDKAAQMAMIEATELVRKQELEGSGPGVDDQGRAPLDSFF